MPQNLKARLIYQNAEVLFLLSLPRHKDGMKSNNGSQSRNFVDGCSRNRSKNGKIRVGGRGREIPNHSSLLITAHVFIFTLDIIDTGGPFPCRARDNSKFDPASLESPRQLDEAFEINTIPLRGHVFS